jgi:uncharacterized protein (UPF0147 family)
MANDPFAEFANNPHPAAQAIVADPFAEFANATPQPSRKDAILSALAIPQSNAVGAIRSFGRGASLGLSDTVGEGVNALINSNITGTPFLKQFAADKDQANAERDQFRTDSPKLAYGSEIAGAIASAPLASRAVAGGAAMLKGGAEAAATGKELANIAKTGTDIVEAAPAIVKGAKGAGVAMQAAKGLGVGAAQGGLYGATEADSGGAGSNALTGALTGAVIGGTLPLVGNALKSAISPAASTNPNVQILMKEGVRPTAAEVSGGAINKLEERLQTLPWTGDIIAGARERPQAQLRDAVFNRALSPIGEKIPKGLDGWDAVSYAKKALGDKYDEVLNKIGAITPDAEFKQKLDSLTGLVGIDTAPRNIKQNFNKAISRVSDAIDENGVMTSSAYKKLESSLGADAKTLGQMDSVYAGDMSNAVKQIREELRGMLERQSGDSAKELAAVNKGWANFKRGEKAAGMTGALEGNFNADQLYSTARSMAGGKDKSQWSSRNALMQDISAAAKDVMGRKTGTSGTAENKNATDLIAQGLGLLGSVPAAALYSEPVQNFLLNRVATRGAWAEPTGNALNAITQRASTPAIVMTEDAINSTRKPRVSAK